ncbi:MAG TPA: 5'-3' exonuclease H3TH domain-containing protein [Gemmatimonadaceae bacterium]|nr:5'-3' exonuclease H3TH domain-containing protein [Gemmatimonadaceae bacterium]
MTLLLVDGSNILMRCAFGGDVAAEKSTPMAAAMIERAARECHASHLMIALDFPGVPTWRHKAFPAYKGHRTRDTSSWLIAGATEFARRRWHVEVSSGFEADDIIATIANRSAARAEIVVLSNDSDLLALTAHGVGIARPVTGGTFDLVDESGVCVKYGIPIAARLADLKAMTGETGDNVPGVPGIGPTRAAKLITRLGSLEDIIMAGEGGYSKDSAAVYEHRDIARLSLTLATLRIDVPIDPIAPRQCAWRAS